MNADRPLAVITGASRRVGRATAIELARGGFDLIVTCYLRRRELDETVALAREAAWSAGREPEIRSFEVNLDDDDDAGQFIEVLSRQSRLDALVHNASSYESGPLGQLDAPQLLRHFRVNAMNPLLLTQAAAEPLRQSLLPHGGCVVYFSDIHVLGRPRRNYLAYTMSKSALSGTIEALARELAPRVRVNGIAPGVVAWPDGTPRREIDAYEERIPLERAGTPEDAARLVRWLIVEAGYITGEIIRLDGGRWLA